MNRYLTRSRANNREITNNITTRVMLPKLETNLTLIGEAENVNVSRVRRQLQTPRFLLVTIPPKHCIQALTCPRMYFKRIKNVVRHTFRGLLGCFFLSCALIAVM